MIIDSVKSFEKYKTLVPGFDKVYDFFLWKCMIHI